MDVSGNDNYIDQEDTTSNDTSGFEPNYQSGEDYLSYVQSEIRADSSVDYSGNFANIETLFKFQIAVIIGMLLCICFIVGWRHD